MNQHTVKCCLIMVLILAWVSGCSTSSPPEKTPAVRYKISGYVLDHVQFPEGFPVLMEYEEETSYKTMSLVSNGNGDRIESEQYQFIDKNQCVRVTFTGTQHHVVFEGARRLRDLLSSIVESDPITYEDWAVTTTSSTPFVCYCLRTVEGWGEVVVKIDASTCETEIKFADKDVFELLDGFALKVSD